MFQVSFLFLILILPNFGLKYESFSLFLEKTTSEELLLNIGIFSTNRLCRGSNFFNSFKWESKSMVLLKDFPQKEQEGPFSFNILFGVFTIIGYLFFLLFETYD